MTKKVYAVRVGRTTGVFNSWAACKKQVDGFPAARYKSFTDLAEALQWLNGSDAPRRTPTVSAGAAVRKKRNTSVLSAGNEAAKRPDNEQDFVIYTDGSCLRNPDGPGGWAAVIRDVRTGKITELADGDPSTTNNRMELSAAIAALTFPQQSSKIALYTDSQYLKNGFTRHWLTAWKKRGWKKADGQPVLNQDLWKQLDTLYTKHDVTFHWVKGHVGVELNERCDKLAKREAMRFAH